jgi:MFS family permease
MNCILPCALLTGVLTLCLIPIHNVGGIIVFALLFGFFSGSFVSLPPTIVVHLTPDRRFIGTRMGMAFMFISTGVLIGTPIGGAILKASGFTALWIYGGVMVIAGTALMALTRGLHKGWDIRTKV